MEKIMQEVDLIDVDGVDDLIIKLTSSEEDEGVFFVTVTTMATSDSEIVYKCKSEKIGQVQFALKMGDLMKMGYRLVGENEGVAALKSRVAIA